MESIQSEKLSFDLPKNVSNVIKVIGVGGGGSNAINYMFKQGINGVDFVVTNTDAQALNESPVPIKIQLGASLTEGLGAGANPEVGAQAAKESFEDLKNLLTTQTKMVFITAGMGGGTGTGAAPIIAKMARELDVLTVGIVTMPFDFEGKIRINQAEKGLENIKKSVDSLIVINNNKLREVYGNLGFKAGFSKADEVLASAAKGIAEVITHHYTQNVDLKDARTVLFNSGTAIMGSASSSSNNRAQDAITKALDSPLLNDNRIVGCKNVLLLIVSGNEEITIDEIGEINDFIQEEAGNNTNIIMGVGEDESLGNSISVTIIATGFPADQQSEIVNIEAKKIIHTLEIDQKIEQDLMNSHEKKQLSTDFIDKDQEQLESDQENLSSYKSEDDFNLTDDIREMNVTYETLDSNHNNEELNFEEIKNMEVVYDILDYSNDEVIVTEEMKDIDVSYDLLGDESDRIEFKIEKNTKTDYFDLDVVDPEYLDSNFDHNINNEIDDQNQIEFDFDLPVKDINFQKKESMDKLYDQSEKIVNDKIKTETIDSQTDIENDFKFELKESSKSEIEEKIENEILQDEEKNETREVNQSNLNLNLSPFEQKIDESLSQENEKRIEHLKKFNYSFSNSRRVDELEKQPAYKRIGIDLEESFQKSDQENSSRISIDEDSNEEIQLRSNNSFLHDNVD
ncbi:MAG: cell division protein FtsZ [Flavobacteriaceae bacterium]|nr:cell division protein FtsZ [Flavobacteriaceae bacterium]